MAQDNWMDKRQRAVRCKIHGLHYDPEMTSGCTLCRKEGLEAAPRQKPQLVVMLLCLLGVAMILYHIFGPGDVTADIPATEEAGAAAVAATPSGFDVEPYRDAIGRVEQAIFETPGSDFGAMSEQIVIALSGLARELASDTAGRTGEAVTAVEGLASRLSGSTLDLGMLRDLRVEWDQLRRRHFGNQVWYVRLSTVDERIDRAALSVYRDVASELLSLVNQGSDLAQTLSQTTPVNLAAPDEEQRKREEWDRFRSEWQTQLSDLKRRLPGWPGADTDPQILLAAQRLDDAFAQSSSLAAAGDWPSPDRLNAALGSVEKANRSFEDLLSQ